MKRKAFNTLSTRWSRRKVSSTHIAPRRNVCKSDLFVMQGLSFPLVGEPVGQWGICTSLSAPSAILASVRQEKHEIDPPSLCVISTGSQVVTDTEKFSTWPCSYCKYWTRREMLLWTRLWRKISVETYGQLTGLMWQMFSINAVVPVLTFTRDSIQ